MFGLEVAWCHSLSFFLSVFFLWIRYLLVYTGTSNQYTRPPLTLPRWMGEAAPFWAAGIQSLEYKSEFSRDVIEIKNSRTLVDWLRCRQHCRPGVKHSCTICPFREILSPFYRDERTWRPPFILHGLLQMFVFASYHCVTEVVLAPASCQLPPSDLWQNAVEEREIQDIHSGATTFDRSSPLKPAKSFLEQGKFPNLLHVLGSVDENQELNINNAPGPQAAFLLVWWLMEAAQLMSNGC